MKSILRVTLIFGFSSLAFATGCKAENIKTEKNTEIMACLMDAKTCPDGSHVSRILPNCDFAPCSSEKQTSKEDKLVDALIIGSAETPDPVLEKIYELEKEGVVSNVVVMESFPVQISIKAPQKIIDDLKSMPRIISPSFQ